MAPEYPGVPFPIGERKTRYLRHQFAILKIYLTFTLIKEKDSIDYNCYPDPESSAQLDENNLDNTDNLAIAETVYDVPFSIGFSVRRI